MDDRVEDRPDDESDPPAAEVGDWGEYEEPGSESIRASGQRNHACATGGQFGGIGDMAPSQGDAQQAAYATVEEQWTMRGKTGADAETFPHYMVPSPVSFPPSHGDDVPSYEMTWNRIVQKKSSARCPST